MSGSALVKNFGASKFRRQPIYAQIAGSRSKRLDTMSRTTYKLRDYVTRRFNAPSAELKSGLNLR